MDSKLIYIKFTNKSIKKIEKYNHLLTDKNIYNKFTIYIWIYYYDKENIDYINNLKNIYPLINLITSVDVSNYLSNDELNEISFLTDEFTLPRYSICGQFTLEVIFLFFFFFLSFIVPKNGSRS